MLRMLLGLVALSAVSAAAVLAKPPEGSASPKSGVFEFVGYSSTPVVGDVGLQEIYETCQDDFGLGARMCTWPEFYLSPNAEALPVAGDEAWVELGFGTPGQPCDNWTSILGSLGNTIRNEDGKIRRRTVTCDSDLPVTCCARLQ